MNGIIRKIKKYFLRRYGINSGRGINVFQAPCMWAAVPFGYPFSTGIDEFIISYKKSAKELSVSRMKDIRIEYNENNLNVRLFF